MVSNARRKLNNYLITTSKRLVKSKYIHEIIAMEIILKYTGDNYGWLP